MGLKIGRSYGVRRLTGYVQCGTLNGAAKAVVARARTRPATRQNVLISLRFIGFSSRSGKLGSSEQSLLGATFRVASSRRVIEESTARVDSPLRAFIVDSCD